MKEIVLLLLLLPLLLLIDGKTKVNENEKKSVSISKDDYCNGCVETVNCYAARLVNGLKKYEANSIVEGTVFSAESIIQNLCDDPYFDKLDPNVKYSCIKIINDNSTSFMQNFEGKLDRNFNQVKGTMFSLKKKVCVYDVKACSDSRFQMANIPSNMKNKCSACKIIASDIDSSIKINMNNKVNKVKVEEIVDNVCDGLGFNHSPYSWVEDYCEEMIEDNYATIVDATKFRKKLYSTRFTPDKLYADDLCEELYKCGKEKTDL